MAKHRTPSGRNPKEAIARLTIKGVDEMSPARRADLRRWLEEQGRQLVEEGDNYDGEFTARYFLP